MTSAPTRRAPLRALDGGASLTSWEPVDLSVILDGGDLEGPPEYLTRTDGVPLIHPGKITVFAGEPESCKGWKALHVVAERLATGEHALYVDFEAGAQETVARLLALGASTEEIAGQFHYVSPDLPLTDDGKRAMGPALAHQPTIVVLDGLTEAFALHGLKIEDNTDAARFLHLLAKPLAARGAAVILIDHVTKNRETRGRYSLGAQHKLAGVDVAYGLDVVQPFGRGREGLVKIKIAKDRSGYVRQHSNGELVALMRLTSHEDGAVTIRLEPPPATDSGEGFRPTVLMERVSRAVESHPGLSKRALRETVKGKASVIDLALELLITDEYVTVKPEGTAQRHHSLRPYREEADEGSE